MSGLAAMSKYSIKTITYLFLLMLIAGPAGAQTVKSQTAQKPQHKMQHKPQATQKKQGMQLRGKLEKLSCKLGTEDRHARIAVELIGGRLKSLAYYSKWKPRTCSVHIVRDDAFSKWEDPGSVTIVTLNEEKGAFLIDYSRTSVKFLFRDIDRERFCGMTGKITGTLTVTRGRDQCELEGVMDENFEQPVAVTPGPVTPAAPGPAVAPVQTPGPAPTAVPGLAPAPTPVPAVITAPPVLTPSAAPAAAPASTPAPAMTPEPVSTPAVPPAPAISVPAAKP